MYVTEFLSGLHVFSLLMSTQSLASTYPLSPSPSLILSLSLSLV